MPSGLSPQQRISNCFHEVPHVSVKRTRRKYGFPFSTPLTSRLTIAVSLNIWRYISSATICAPWVAFVFTPCHVLGFRQRLAVIVDLDQGIVENCGRRLDVPVLLRLVPSMLQNKNVRPPGGIARVLACRE
jgi:hypothetical protein